MRAFRLCPRWLTTLLLLAPLLAFGPPAPPLGAAPGQAPATPQWPAVDLVDQVQSLLLHYYDQEAVAGEGDYTYRAPNSEADKRKAWKDPDTLWEHFGGGAETKCHTAYSDMDFINCTGHRLAHTFNLSGYGGNLTLFDAARGYYANDAYAQIAGYYAVYHAFLLDYDTTLDNADPRVQSRANKTYHRRMIKAYEAHMRNILIKMFFDLGAQGNAEFQAALTRSIGLTAAIYTAVAQAMEEQGIWGKADADRSRAIALINGLNQRLFWEWVWPQQAGPRTAGFSTFGSYLDYHLLASSGRSDLIGTDVFYQGSDRIQSLRPPDLNVAPYNGLWVDADYTIPGEWWCVTSYASGTADRATCLAHAQAESLGGSRSPFGQFYGADGTCTARPGIPTGFSCADTSLGSIAEEWTWTYVGARKGMYLIKRLQETGEPHTPYGPIGANTHEVKPGVTSSAYQMATDRVGYGISGWHGGPGYQDDMEWEWHRGSGPSQAIRTLSAAGNDYLSQNDRYSLGEADTLPSSPGLDGDTWSIDRQDYPGGMENHAPGPNPLYGTLLYQLVLWDQVSDGAGGGLSGSFYDTSSRNHPDEFANWVWLLLSSYYRCRNVADPLDASCADFGGGDRQALFVDPAGVGTGLRFAYLWRDPDRVAPTPLVHATRIAAGKPTGAPYPTCRGGTGLPWRGVYDYEVADDKGDEYEAADDAAHLVDELGNGAYNNLVQGLGGFMRVVAARYPLAAPPGFEAGYQEQKQNVLKPWYDEAYRLVEDILHLYGPDPTPDDGVEDTYDYVPDIENSICQGDPGGGSMVLSWRYGTGDSIQETTERRAQWYSILAVWYLWYDSTWLDVDPAVWIAR